jgi:SAM-dependent methyltransferase
MQARSGPGIREFLEYYLLVLLSRRRRTAPELLEEISRRSKENQAYRKNGALCIERAEMEEVLRKLAHTKLINHEPKSRRWGGTTAAGDRERKRIEQQYEDVPDSKERAADELVTLVSASGSKGYVLDVGTGDGFMAFKVAARGLDVLGIDSGRFDYSKDSIEKARESTVPAMSKRVEFRRADVTELRGMDGAFDFVVASQAVHCMNNQVKCLEAIHRLLKPAGQFISADLSVGVKGFLKHGFHCFLAISPEEWERLLPQCGFEPPRIHDLDDFIVVQAQKPA